MMPGNRFNRFAGLAILSAWAVAAPLGASSARAEEPATWFAHARVGLEVGPTGAQFGGAAEDVGYAANFRGDEIARAAKAAAAEYLVIWARDGDWAYYDSKLQPKPPGLGARDVLREAAGEGRRLGLPVIAYCQVQNPTHALRKHPDWRMIDKDGDPVEGRVCYRSDYLNYMKEMVDEQLALGIAGFHLDMVDQGFGPPYGCWCARCATEFKARWGRAMPKGATWDEDWDHMLELRYDASQEFEKKLRAHIREVNPKATVDYNYHGSPPFSWEVGQRPVQHAGNADFVTGETGVWGFSALTVGLNAEFYRAATPGAPFQIAMQRGVRMYHDQTTRPLNDMRWEMFTLLAHGGFVTIVDKTGFDGWLDPVAYERFGAAFREARAKAETFGHEPVYQVGVYFSARSRDWIGREKPATYFQAFQGAAKALDYEHIPWGVILDENVSSDGLKKFPVVLLPNVGIVSEREAALLRGYVEAGGNLIITGATGTSGGRGEPLAQSAPAGSTLAKLTGARFVRELETNDNWARFPSAPEVQGGLQALAPRMDWPFLVRGPAVVYAAETATPAGELLAPTRTALHAAGRYPKDWPMSAGAPAGPLALLNRVGKGAVLTLAVSPDWATASDHAVVETRGLLASAVRMLDPEPRVVIQAPVTVQTVVNDDPAARALRIHFLGYNAPPQTTPPENRPYVLPPTIEDAPLFRASVTMRDDFKDAEAFDKNTSLVRTGRKFDLLINDVHEVVAIRY